MTGDGLERVPRQSSRRAFEAVGEACRRVEAVVVHERAEQLFAGNEWLSSSSDMPTSSERRSVGVDPKLPVVRIGGTQLAALGSHEGVTGYSIRARAWFEPSRARHVTRPKPQQFSC